MCANLAYPQFFLGWRLWWMETKPCAALPAWFCRKLTLKLQKSPCHTATQCRFTGALERQRPRKTWTKAEIHGLTEKMWKYMGNSNVGIVENPNVLSLICMNDLDISYPLYVRCTKINYTAIAGTLLSPYWIWLKPLCIAFVAAISHPIPIVTWYPSWPVRIVAHHNLRHTPTTCACIISNMCFILIELQYIYINIIYIYTVSSIYIHLSSSFYMDTTHPPDLFIRPSTNTSIGFQHFPAAYLWNSLDSHSSKTTVERGGIYHQLHWPLLAEMLHTWWIWMDIHGYECSIKWLWIGWNCYGVTWIGWWSHGFV